MSENIPEFKISEETDPEYGNFLKFTTINPKLHIRLEIEPALTDNLDVHIPNVLSTKRLDVSFINTDSNKLMYPLTAYRIQESEIPDLDASDRSNLEKSLAKYSVNFSKLTHYKGFDDLVAQTFPDIVEKRLQKP